MLKKLRQIHLYLGLFLSPTILFFAFSGALQIFRLQESHRGSSYQPASWIVVLAGVHKDQRYEAKSKPNNAPQANEAAAPKQPEPTEKAPPPMPRASSALLKWFFLFASVGMIITTVIGIIMAFMYNRDRRLIWGLLILGTVLPIVLLIL